MTTITFESINDCYSFNCTGHTGYASAGADILCSAVSILCYTLERHLSKLSSEGDISGYEIYFADGDVNARFIFPEYSDKCRILCGIESVLGGFLLLEESFPDYIRTDLELSI